MEEEGTLTYKERWEGVIAKLFGSCKKKGRELTLLGNGTSRIAYLQVHSCVFVTQNVPCVISSTSRE